MKPFGSLALSPPALCVPPTSRAPAAALGAITNVAVAVLSSTTTRFVTETPAPKSKVVPVLKPRPPSVTLTLLPAVPLAGVIERRSNCANAGISPNEIAVCTVTEAPAGRARFHCSAAPLSMHSVALTVLLSWPWPISLQTALKPRAT